MAEEGDHCSALQLQLLTNLPLTSYTLTSFDFRAYRHRAWPASSPMHPPASVISCAYLLFILLSSHAQQAEQAASAWSKLDRGHLGIRDGLALV